MRERRSVAYPNMEAGSFLLEVPSPATATRHLSVSTDGDEVTVGFGSEWHDHYGSWTGDDEETSFRQALEAIEALLSERTVVVVGYRDGRPAWSTAQRINDQLPSWDAERYEIISWSGKHDRVEWPA